MESSWSLSVPKLYSIYHLVAAPPPTTTHHPWTLYFGLLALATHSSTPSPSVRGQSADCQTRNTALLGQTPGRLLAIFLPTGLGLLDFVSDFALPSFSKNRIKLF